MVFDLNHYLDRQFDLESYNCWDFTREVWLALTGQELTLLKDWEPGTIQQAQGQYVELRQAVSPCVVLFQGRSAAGHTVPHAGVYYNGRVLHLRQQGARYQGLHLARIGFHTVTFYATR